MIKLHLLLKRFLDIVLSSIAILLLLPIWLTIPFWIRFDSKGPILFRQARRTKDGRIFDMLKFRTMVVNAEQMGAGLFNFENDPRVTKAGQFLRKTSLDELPQLFNILLGDMSIVGPRPCVSYELGDFETLNNRYKKRFSVKAGLTGLAQVKGRNDISWDDKVTYDNQYIDLFAKYGIWVDLWIILQTITSVFKKENIYETKAVESMEDAKAAQLAEEEIIRIAHLPD